MPSRRQILKSSFTLLAASAFPVCAEPRASAPSQQDPNTRNHGPHWARDIPWQKSSHSDFHDETIHLAFDKTALIRFPLAPLDQFNWQHDLFHGDPVTSPHPQIAGLKTFYGTSDRSAAQNAANVLDGGAGALSTTSIWLVGWDFKSIFMVGNPVNPSSAYPPPKGALVIRDWRYAARIANVSFFTSSADAGKLIRRAADHLPTWKPNTAIYIATHLYRGLEIEDFKGLSYFFRDRLRPVDALNKWERPFNFATV